MENKMTRTMKNQTAKPIIPTYAAVVSDISTLLLSARRAAARSVNSIMTATYWEIGRRIVEYEQGGSRRAEYGIKLIARLADDLTGRFGRGFGADNLELMRKFYLTFPPDVVASRLGRNSESRIRKLPPAKISESLIRKFDRGELNAVFPLSWTHYIHLISRSRSAAARDFYETEALRGGWSVRQLSRQIGTQFYERTALSRDKMAMLKKGMRRVPGARLTADEEIRDPLLLEFLNLKDEYSEHDLEEALIRHLESFLLELGGDFTFVGRQRRLRLDHTWYRIDLIFYHRALRCLVLFDLKLDALTHADVGQMHLYCNYARHHWTREGENPPVGIILCAGKGAELARYALEGLPNQTLVREYRTFLPKEKVLTAELARTRKLLETRLAARCSPAARRSPLIARD